MQAHDRSGALSRLLVPHTVIAPADFERWRCPRYPFRRVSNFDETALATFNQGLDLSPESLEGPPLDGSW